MVSIEAEALDEQPEREPDEQAAQSLTLTALPMKVSDFSCERKAIAADHLVPDKVVTDEDETEEDEKDEEELPKAKRRRRKAKQRKPFPKRGMKYAFRLVGP